MAAQFDPDDYNRRVLGPAVESFKREGRLPDLFERYGLPLEIADAGVIAAAVTAMKAYWDRTKINPKFKELIPVLLAAHAGAARELLDPDARALKRAVTAAERKQRQDARFAALDQSIKVIAGKGFVTRGERTALIERFVREGLTEADIVGRLVVPEGEAVVRVPVDQGLPRSVRETIRSSLGVLAHCDRCDLYHFLGLSAGASQREIVARHQQLQAEWSVRQADFRKTAANALLGVVKSHLIDGDPRKYDAARIHDLLDRLRPEVEIAASDKRITRDGLRTLVAIATGYGVDAATATDYVVALADEFGAHVELEAAEESLRCPRCATTCRRKGGPDRCRVCGAKLWTGCPRCKARVPASEQACGGCGFLVGELPRVQLLVRQAELAVEDGRLADALDAARAAERLWGRQGELVALLQTIEERVARLDRVRAQVDDELAGRRLFAARSTLGAIVTQAADHRFRDGKTIGDLARDVDARLQEVKRFLDRGRDAERERRLDDAAFAYQDALGVAVDCEEAATGLRRCPPAPPPRVGASVHDGQVLVDWSASVAIGDVEYVVVRREGRAPTSIEDGTVVFRGRALGCVDAQARSGALTFHGVSTVRGGAASRPATTRGLLITREVADFVVEAGDASVSGHWTSPGGSGRVRVYRRAGSAPIGPKDATEVALASSHTFVDSGLDNGRAYHYRVVVEHDDPAGGVVSTAGVLASATPERPPQPIEHLEIAARDDRLWISWSPPPRGTVAIYRSDGEPAGRPGSLVPRARWTELGTPLAGASVSTASDRAPAGGVAYYRPVTVVGELAVLGRVRRYVALADVEGVEAHDFGSYLQLRWRWPPGCEVAVVAWRGDGYPTDADDPQAIRRRVSKGELEQHGGFRLEQPAAGPLHFVVFAAARVGADEVCSAGLAPGCRAALRARAPVTIAYDVTWGLFRRQRGTVVVRCAEAVAVLPELVLVARRGDVQPLRLDEGVAVATVAGASIPGGGSVSSEFALDGVRPPAYLRAFFRDPDAYQRFKLVDPHPSQLRVR